MKMHKPTIYIGVTVMTIAALLWPDTAALLQGVGVLLFLSAAMKD